MNRFTDLFFSFQPEHAYFLLLLTFPVYAEKAAKIPPKHCQKKNNHNITSVPSTAYKKPPLNHSKIGLPVHFVFLGAKCSTHSLICCLRFIVDHLSNTKNLLRCFHMITPLHHPLSKNAAHTSVETFTTFINIPAQQ